MGRNTSVSLGDYFEEFVENRILQGRYKNASEVIRDGISTVRRRKQGTSFENAIREGIDSGTAGNFDAKKHLETLKTNKRNNG